MFYRTQSSEFELKRGLSVTVILIGLAVQALAEAPATSPRSNAAPTGLTLILSGRQSSRPAGTYSAGIADIIRMLDAKMSSSVVLAYIQNSLIAYNPDATELIALQEHGASTEMLTALLHRGDELRLRLAQAQKAAAAAGPVAIVEPAPEFFPEEPPAPPLAPGPDSGDQGYPATTYYAFAYYYPWLCRTPVCNSYRPYRFEHGSWHTDGHQFHATGESIPGTWAEASTPASQPAATAFAPGGGHASSSAPFAPSVTKPVSAPGTGHASSAAPHSGPARDSGHWGGRSGGSGR